MVVQKPVAQEVKPIQTKKTNKRGVVRAIVYFIMAFVFATVQFYSMIPIVSFTEEYAQDIVIKLVEYGGFVYLVVSASWQNWALSILFLILGGTELIGVKKNGNGN